MNELDARRRFYAEDVQLSANVQSAALVEALATVPRERFLPPGPWTIRGEGDVQRTPRLTPDADPKWLYHNVAVAIDPARQLFNGAPGILAMAIDAAGLKPGDRVLHLGTGLGYYTALMAHCVGPRGRVLGVDVDTALAAGARANLADTSWVELREGDGADLSGETFDTILINAGVTHPLPQWLDALAPGGRMVLPLTATMPAMGPIGKGLLVLVDRPVDELTSSPVDQFPSWGARVLTFVAIYSALGLRDDDANRTLGMALQRNPFPPIKSLRRDPHDAGPTCWLHRPGACVSLDAVP